MFKEIETELMSIISADPIEKIAHAPTMEIAKTMELIYNIKFEDIKKVYTEALHNNTHRMSVVINSSKNKITKDICLINGKLYHIFFIPEKLINVDENNAIDFTNSVIDYISYRVALLAQIYGNTDTYNSFTKVIYVSIPIITCAIIRQIYSGASVPKIIHETLSKKHQVYCDYNIGIDSVLNLFDEGLSVEDLLDNAFICAIKDNDKKYPGIWDRSDPDDEEVEE